MQDIRLKWIETGAQHARYADYKPSDSVVDFADFYGAVILRIKHTRTYGDWTSPVSETYYAVFDERNSNVAPTAEAVEEALSCDGERARLWYVRNTREAKRAIAYWYGEQLETRKRKSPVQFVEYCHATKTSPEMSRASGRDCVPRAIGYALRQSYSLTVKGIDAIINRHADRLGARTDTCRDGTPTVAWSEYLRERGWKRINLYGAYNEKMQEQGYSDWGQSPFPRMGRIIKENPQLAEHKGVLLFCQRTHLVACDKGKLLDTWNSTGSNRIIRTIWYRPEDGMPETNLPANHYDDGAQCE